MTRPIKDLAKSVHTRLLTLAKKTGRPFTEVLQLYAMEVAGRWEFVGKPAQQAVRDRYVHRSVAAHLTAGAQNPIAYVGC